MKKIFAIALALVMVFSMASAFALNDCFSGFDWTCSTTTTDCGKAKVEVVPYVKVNNGCGGYDWQVNDCATAIVSEEVFFAVKLTVDAYVDGQWWADSWVEVEVSDGLIVTVPTIDALAVELGEDEEQVFYLDKNGKWFDADAKGFKIANVMWAAEVDFDGADDAEVCATLFSYNNGFDNWEYGDYDVEVATTTDASGDFGTLKIFTTTPCANNFVMEWEDGKVTKIEASSAAFMNEVMAKFNLAGCVIGTCVDADIVERNFGWDDEFESCFSWSNKGAAVVNPECVVAIPKTGDVSVVAYAVMAVVAAAGAMLKK